MTVAPAPPRVSTPLLAGVLCLVWSSAFVFVKLGLRDASAAQFGAARVVAAVPPLALALVLRDGAGLRRALADRRVHAVGLVLGAVNVAGFIGLQTAGFELAGIGFGAVLIYAQPLLVAALAAGFLGERLRPRQVLGLLTGWVGVGLVVLGEASGAGAVRSLGTAVLLFLGAAACFAVGTVVVKAVTTGPRAVPLAPALLLALTYGALPLVALALADPTPRSTCRPGWHAEHRLHRGALAGRRPPAAFAARARRRRRGEQTVFAVPVLAAVSASCCSPRRCRPAARRRGRGGRRILLVTVPGRPPPGGGALTPPRAGARPRRPEDGRMTATLVLSVPVAAPAAATWAGAVDWDGQGEWMLGTRVKGTAQDGRGVGGGIEAFTGVGPVGFLDAMEIAAWDPPRRCDVRHVGRVVRGTGTFRSRSAARRRRCSSGARTSTCRSARSAGSAGRWSGRSSPSG